MKTRLALALLCLGPQLGGADAPLGRLFHTAPQRAQLDRLRQQPVAVDGENSPFLTLDGEVRRSAGPPTHWINGQAQPGPRPGQAPPPLVGDRIDRRSGETQSLLRDGQVRLKRATR